LTKNFQFYGDSSASIEKFAEEITIDSLDLNKDDYLKNCIYESMRLDPPVPFATSFTVTENITAGKYNIKAGDMMFANIDKLHHLEDQWGPDFNVYKPERFATRGTHHPMSYMPFLAGKRVCAGKAFAENSMKVVLPLILKAF
jgi:cytochrome P450